MKLALPSLRRRMLIALMTALALTTPTLAADPGTPIVSGLAWRSGAAGDEDVAGWRGRPLDVRTVFIGHRTWEEMFQKSSSRFFARSCNSAPLCVVSLAMFPRNVKQQFQACNAGAFDPNYTRIAQNMARARATGVVVRIGWEANGPKGRGYHIGSAANVEPYKQCFRRIALILKEASPDYLIDWSNAKKGSLPFNVMDTYPGDDVVDVISMHYCDSGPRKSTQALWDDYAQRTHKGGPWGIATWLAEAKKRGKKLGVPEWGVWAGKDKGPPDNPVYIASMFAFFQANAADIAYENYHNMNKAHQLYPATTFPKARAEYLRLWGNLNAQAGTKGRASPPPRPRSPR